MEAHLDQVTCMELNQIAGAAASQALHTLIQSGRFQPALSHDALDSTTTIFGHCENCFSTGP